MEKLKVGILGATGMVGQNYITLLEDHPWFEVTYVAASPRSAGKSYEEAVEGRWYMKKQTPEKVKNLMVNNANNVDEAKEIAFVFSALELSNKEEVKKLENAYASAEIPVISNASAHRHSSDVPMLIPEINPHHSNAIKHQQESKGWKGFIAVKPNCSLQSYLTPLFALNQFGLKKVTIVTEQAVSGAGASGVPGIERNVIPFIGGEEEKSEKEPMKILGTFEDGEFKYRSDIAISATCTRVDVQDGHTACIEVEFENKPTKEEIIQAWKTFKGKPQELELPFAPVQPIIYTEEDNRPQPELDKDNDKGMAVTVGRLRESPTHHWKFIGLSHNTIRGAAGGGILNAELLYKEGYFN